MKTKIAEEKTIYSYIKYSGNLKAVKAADIGTNISGKIKKIYVQEGESVKAGELLARFSDEQLLQAKEQFLNAQNNYNRLVQVKKKNKSSISQHNLEAAETAKEIARLNYEFAKENIEIKAPFSGIITDVKMKEGENYVSMLPGASGPPSLFRIINTDSLEAEFFISENDVLKVNIGMKTIINIDNSSTDFFGELFFVSSEADLFTGKFRCKTSVKNIDNVLKPNQFAEIKVVLKEKENAVSVPQEAIVNNEYLFIAENSTAKKTEVTLGISNENEIEIIDGVSAGDQVIIQGNIGLKNYAEIEVRN